MPNFFSTYKKSIIAALVTLFVASAIPTSIWFHDAWGDDRYVLKAEDLRQQIQQIDNALFEIDQEISFAETDRDRRKWTARKAYYLREKEALKEKLLDKTSKGD